MGRAGAALEVEDGALGDLLAFGQDIVIPGEYGASGTAISPPGSAPNWDYVRLH